MKLNRTWDNCKVTISLSWRRRASRRLPSLALCVILLMSAVCSGGGVRSLRREKKCKIQYDELALNLKEKRKFNLREFVTFLKSELFCWKFLEKTSFIFSAERSKGARNLWNFSSFLFSFCSIQFPHCSSFPLLSVFTSSLSLSPTKERSPSIKSCDSSQQQARKKGKKLSSFVPSCQLEIIWGESKKSRVQVFSRCWDWFQPTFFSPRKFTAMYC